MDLVGFADVNVRDPELLLDFLDHNAIAHQNVNDMLRTKGVVIDAYPLFTPTFTEDWIEIHSKEHDAWAQALNIPTPADLSDVDLGNLGGISDWLGTHALHHSLIAEALGV